MKRARILVVDDTPTNLDLLRELLAPHYRVTFALNGMDALALASSDTQPDLILLDIMMPDLDGYQVCQALKENEKTSHIPIIFITSMSSPHNEEQGFSLGAVDYITKPITPSVVLARIKTHLALYNQRRLLQDLVSERTSELEKALQDAETAGRAKSIFLANISHELRTPLNGIMGMTQLLLESNPSEEQQDFLKDAKTSSERLMSMVENLLQLAKAEAGQINHAPTAVNVRQALASTTHHYAASASKKGLKFKAMIHSDVPEKVHVDFGLIRQVLMNLLNNAVKFTYEGEVRLTIKAWGIDSISGTNLLFTVSDTGCGIDSDIQEYIFDPFAIGEDYMTKKQSGAGLGLAIVKQLVTLMGGRIWLEKDPEAVTTFSFNIPCGPESNQS